MKSNCTALAATLSAAYRSFEPYAPGGTDESINSYLSRNGVLITLCMRYRGFLPPFECSLPKKAGEAHMSASWIQEDVTGFRVVDSFVDLGPRVGYILDPSVLDVACMYPFDASTTVRKNDGCGQIKPAKDLSFTDRLIIKAAIEKKKIERFKDVPWSEISCKEFLSQTTTSCTVPLQGSSCQERKKQAGAMPLTYISSVEILAHWDEQVMGHPICNMTTANETEPSFDKGVPLLYAGDCFWEAEDWNPMVDTMATMLERHSQMDIWNEIVLRWNGGSAPEDLVQAVFYIPNGNAIDDAEACLVAMREAHRIHRPLFKVNRKERTVSSLRNSVDLFSCQSE